MNSDDTQISYWDLKKDLKNVSQHELYILIESH